MTKALEALSAYDKAAFGGAIDLTGAALATGFSRFKRKADAGQSAHLVIWSDSTGNIRDNPGRWPDKLADKLVAAYPTHSVIIHTYNTSTLTAFDAAVTRSTGTTTAELHLWIVAISGSVMQKVMGSKWLGSIGMLPCDGLIINHGINYAAGWDAAGTGGAIVRGALAAAIESFLLAQSDVPISATIQPPNRDNNSQDDMPLWWRRIGARYGCSLVDVFSPYAVQGKPGSFYLDDKHPSEAGNVLWGDLVWAHYQASPTSALVAPATHLRRTAPNLVPNGDFRLWTNTATAPDGWTVSGTVAFTKDLTAPADRALGYSVKMQGSGSGQAYMNYALSSAERATIAGKRVTLAVRNKAGVTGATTVGRVALLVSGTGGVTYQSVNGASAIEGRDDWNWIVLQDIPIPADSGGVQVRLYADSATTPDTTNPAWFDQVWLGAGDVPYAARL